MAIFGWNIQKIAIFLSVGFGKIGSLALRKSFSGLLCSHFTKFAQLVFLDINWGNYFLAVFWDCIQGRTVSLVTIATIDKESFPLYTPNNFLIRFLWCIYEVLLWSTTSDIFARFSVLATMATSPQNFPSYNIFLIFLSHLTQM